MILCNKHLVWLKRNCKTPAVHHSTNLLVILEKCLYHCDVKQIEMRWGRWAYRANSAGKTVMYAQISFNQHKTDIGLKLLSFCAAFVVYQFHPFIHRIGSHEFAEHKKNSWDTVQPAFGLVLLLCQFCCFVPCFVRFAYSFFLPSHQPNQYIMCIM